MNIKNIVLLSVIFMMGALHLNAQNEFHDDDHNHNHNQADIEKIQKLRADFLIKELALTDAETKEFMPLVNEYLSAKFKSYKDYRTKSKEFRKKNDKGVVDYDKAIDSYLESESKKTALEKDFYQKARKILPAEKVYKYRSAEHQFMHKMLDGRRTQQGKERKSTKK